RQPKIAGGGSALTALRLEGFAPSVVERKSMLERELRRFGELATAPEPVSRALWRAVRDVTPLATTGEVEAGRRPLWRSCTGAARGAELAAHIGKNLQAQVWLEWAGGLVWFEPEAEDAAAGIVAAAVAASGGHALLVRAPAALRASVDVLSPQAPALA